MIHWVLQINPKFTFWQPHVSEVRNTNWAPFLVFALCFCLRPRWFPVVGCLDWWFGGFGHLGSSDILAQPHGLPKGMGDVEAGFSVAAYASLLLGGGLTDCKCSTPGKGSNFFCPITIDCASVDLSSSWANSSALNIGQFPHAPKRAAISR